MRTAGFLVLSLALSFAAAGLGGLFTSTGIASGWYETLRRPDWAPPGWVFGPVWTLLYVAMAVAAWLVWWRTAWSDARYALGLYAAQLLLNAFWSFFFFYLRNPLAGLAELLVLWVFVLITTISFWRRVTVAGWLFVPYLSWCTFAAMLNAAIWWLNR
jgi:translocator protein